MLKNAVDITILYLRMTYSSGSTLIFQIIMPLVFTFLIGQATGGFGGVTTSSITVSWTLNVVNEDTGSFGDVLIDRLMADPVLDVDETAIETAVSGVEAGEAIAALVIPGDFSRKLLDGDGVSLDFYSEPDEVRTVQPVEEAILGVASQLSGAVDAAVISANAATQADFFTQAEDEEAYLEVAVARALAAWESPSFVVQVNEDERIEQPESVIPSGINQSSPGMMAMFATFSMVGGAAVLIQERREGTLRRLLVMPISKASILIGKLLGILLTGIVQMGILIAAGALFFGVSWGNAPLALVIIVLAFGLAITGLGTLIAALAKTLAQANAMSTIIVLSISALGGAWWPLEIVPDWMQLVGRFSPISWAMTGFHDIITRGLNITAVLPETGILLAFAAVFLLIGIWQFKYE